MDFYAVCNALAHLRMDPVFDVVHYVMMCIHVKEDVHKTEHDTHASSPFSRQHPFALYVSSMLMCFASQLWFTFLFNQPLAVMFITPEKIAMASAVWYLINYMPGDFIYHLLSVKVIKLLLASMKEVHRVYSIHHGIEFAIKKYPTQYLVQVVAGVLKGSSYLWMKPIDRFIRGVWMPNQNECLYPSFITKASLIASVLFVLETVDVIQIEHTVLFACILLGFVYLKVSMTLLGTKDLFVPFENLFCSVVFGGMWDALRRARSSEVVAHPAATENKLKKA